MGTREPVELKWEPYATDRHQYGNIYQYALVSLANDIRVMALHDTDKGTFAVGIIDDHWVKPFWFHATRTVYNLGPLECLCMVEHYVEEYGP
jgi:hypothetical protein